MQPIRPPNKLTMQICTLCSTVQHTIPSIVSMRAFSYRTIQCIQDNTVHTGQYSVCWDRRHRTVHVGTIQCCDPEMHCQIPCHTYCTYLHKLPPNRSHTVKYCTAEIFAKLKSKNSLQKVFLNHFNQRGCKNPKIYDQDASIFYIKQAILHIQKGRHIKHCLKNTSCEKISMTEGDRRLVLKKISSESKV